MNVTTTRLLPRLALLGTLALLWGNFLLTARWADVPGALNGPKWPYFLLALVAGTVALAAGWSTPADNGPSPRHTRAVAASGAIVLGLVFFSWLPVSTWRDVPFLDDWPIRFHAAFDMMRMLDHGTFVGWEWRFLGGYHSSSDATQGLGTLTYVPMKLFGPLVGFHIAHLLLFAAVPLLVWFDLRQDRGIDDRLPTAAFGFASFLTAGYGYYLIRSGDTNSVGGVVTAMLAITGAHAARTGKRLGAWLLVGGLTLSVYAHPGFFAYASLYLAVDAWLARDWRSALRAGIAITTAVVASLPLTYESWRYPDLFSVNNLVYTPPTFNLADLARALYYNVELTWLPGRWFNDYTGVAMVFMLMAAAIARLDTSRVRFYAVAALVTLAMKWLVNVHTGYVFLRPAHMQVVWMAPVLAALFVRYAGSRAIRWSMVAIIALYLQLWPARVPHIPDIRAFDAVLTQRIETAPGALVLLENNPHRNMNADPGGTTESSRFGTHFEPMVAETTGRRLYSGGYSDGWQWNPWKGRVVAGGTWMGRAISAWPHDAFVADLRRWGVVDLFVWSTTTNAYLNTDARFFPVWTSGTWTQYRLRDADPREIVTAHGSGRLDNRTPRGATVHLTGVTQNDAVTVRTNFHPAWTATFGDAAVALAETGDGQLSFASPCDGACEVQLHYPSRPWLLALALAALAAGVLSARRVSA